jgi:outer membrane protein assembly factor BamB
MHDGLRRRFGLVASGIGILFLVFTGGVAVGVQSWGPAKVISTALSAMRDLRAYASEYLENTPKQHLRKRFYPGDGVTVADTRRMQPGVTFVSGIFGTKLGFRLYGNDGTLLHEWPADFFKIAPEEMSYHFDALTHGEVMLENGDVIANLVGRGLFRFDACGKVLWRNHDKTHHAVALDDQGYVWAPGLGPEYDVPAIASLPFTFDVVRKFDPATGKLLEEIDLVDALLKADLAGIAPTHDTGLGDVFHLNEVEPLPASMAAAFPMFRAGDLLLSSRNFNQLWVLDPATHEIKWWFQGPMIGQHDPDFNPDGTITVLDNRAGGAANEANGRLGQLGGSRILAIDPATKTYHVAYESGPKNGFYTERRGKHQFLDNGNLMVTETDMGRVFEATPDGDIVWQYVNGWDETRVGWVMGATRYPESYGAFASQTCPVPAN